MSIGIPENVFWTLNPKRLKPYDEAERIRAEERDNELWRMGLYVYQATLASTCRSLSGDKSSVKYFEYPLLQSVKEETQAEETTMSEDEEMKQVNAIFNALAIRAANSRLSKQQKGE